MKKLLTAVMLLCALLLSAAQAETFTLNKPRGQEPFMENLNLWYEVTVFEDDVPEALRAALDSSPFAADEVLQGAWLRCYYHRYDDLTDVLNDQAALIAVEHGGRPLLLGLAREGKAWRVSPQSETFLQAGEDFTITAKPIRGNNASAAMLTILCGGDTYLISSGAPDAAWTLYQYQHENPDGTVDFLSMEYGAVVWGTYEEGRTVRQSSFRCVLPSCLAALSREALPRSAEALEAWAQAHPILLAADEGYMGSANLRTKATSSSRSHGQYLAGAKVKLLGQAPGRDFPWYNVRIGDTEGWVSGVYFYTEELDPTNLQSAANRIHPVGRLKEAASLLDAPGGRALASLPAGTEVSVLVEQSGWAHVVVPRNELGCQADWSGDYGYLPVKLLTRAATPLQLRFTGD